MYHGRDPNEIAPVGVVDRAHHILLFFGTGKVRIPGRRSGNLLHNLETAEIPENLPDLLRRDVQARSELFLGPTHGTAVP
ncbi:MAG TPA: hypothetical protein VG267_13045 [Terracidiphilus sp.]|nr:hypothetical protein [Terracidiphilus sp.]